MHQDVMRLKILDKSSMFRARLPQPISDAPPACSQIALPANVDRRVSLRVTQLALSVVMIPTVDSSPLSVIAVVVVTQTARNHLNFHLRGQRLSVRCGQPHEQLARRAWPHRRVRSRKSSIVLHRRSRTGRRSDI